MDEKTRRELRKFVKKVLEKYGRLVKSIVVFGSFVRGEESLESDLDVFIVFDDTIVDLDLERLRVIDDELRIVAKGVSERISLLQSFALTEFVEYARFGHPVVYNLIREGEPIYDDGFFRLWKKLLIMGRIPRTREVVERCMEEAQRRLMRAKTMNLLILVEDCYYVIVSMAQSVLMYIGVEPPIPSRLYDKFVECLVKPGIVEEEYANWIREIIELRKNVEHKKIVEVKGEFIDMWIQRSEKFVDKMFNTLNVLEMGRRKIVLENTFKVIIKTVDIALKNLHGLPKNLSVSDVERVLGLSLKDAFKRDFIESGKIDEYYLTVWSRVEDLVKQVFEEGRMEVLRGDEVERLREDVRRLIGRLSKVVRGDGLTEITSE